MVGCTQPTWHPLIIFVRTFVVSGPHWALGRCTDYVRRGGGGIPPQSRTTLLLVGKSGTSAVDHWHDAISLRGSIPDQNKIRSDGERRSSRTSKKASRNERSRVDQRRRGGKACRIHGEDRGFEFGDGPCDRTSLRWHVHGGQVVCPEFERPTRQMSGKLAILATAETGKEEG